MTHKRKFARQKTLIVFLMVFFGVLFISLNHMYGGKLTERKGAVIKRVAFTHTAAFSTQVITNAQEKEVSLALTAAVPELEEVYFQKLKGVGLTIVGTASLDGYSNRYQVASDMSTRFLLTAFHYVSHQLVYAALYTTYHGRYVMASGLGKDEISKVSLLTIGSDQGVHLMNELAHINQYKGAPQYQAFAEYKRHSFTA